MKIITEQYCHYLVPKKSTFLNTCKVLHNFITQKVHACHKVGLASTHTSTLNLRLTKIINKLKEITMGSCSACVGGWITSCSMVILLQRKVANEGIYSTTNES